MRIIKLFFKQLFAQFYSALKSSYLFANLLFIFLLFFYFWLSKKLENKYSEMMLEKEKNKERKRMKEWEMRFNIVTMATTSALGTHCSRCESHWKEIEIDCNYLKRKPKQGDDFNGFSIIFYPLTIVGGKNHTRKVDDYYPTVKNWQIGVIAE